MGFIRTQKTPEATCMTRVLQTQSAEEKELRTKSATGTLRITDWERQKESGKEQ